MTDENPTAPAGEKPRHHRELRTDLTRESESEHACLREIERLARTLVNTAAAPDGERLQRVLGELARTVRHRHFDGDGCLEAMEAMEAMDATDAPGRGLGIPQTPFREPAVSLTAIGYWRSGDNPRLPDPADLIDTTWNGDERALVVDYLDRGQIARRWMGAARCRICDAPNGADDRTDGVFVWPGGLAHYVEAHGVRLPAEFVTHALHRAEDLDTAAIDHAWWTRQTTRR